MTQDDIHLHADTQAIPAAPQTAGAILAAHRLQTGLSLEDVAGKLKLAKRQIEALEADRYEALPGNTFVRGFVRNYARLLEIDAQPLLNYLAQHLPAEAPQAALPRLQDAAMPMLRPGRGAGRSIVLYILIGILGAILLVGGAAWLYENNHHEPTLTVATPEPVVLPLPEQVVPTEPAIAQPTGPVPEVTTAPVSAADSTPAANAPQTAVPTASLSSQSTPIEATTPTTVPPTATLAATQPPVAEPAGEIRVIAHEDSWVLITDAGGKRLVNEIIKAGESKSFGGKAPYQVRIGNGRHTELFYRSKSIDLTPYLKVDVANLELK